MSEDPTTTPHRSGGPRTEEGKMISRMNALKHGLRSKVLGEDIPEPDEDDIGHEHVLESLMEHYQPQTPTEELLVRRLALLDWRLQRIALAEKKSLKAQPGVTFCLPPAGAMERILKYERTMDRELHRTINLLEKMRSSGRTAPGKCGMGENETAD